MNAPRGRILLVDDDPSLMRLLVLRLEAEGFEVVTAASGTEALQRLRGRPVELMISDLRMEGMDGIELFEHVQHYYPGLPVIIITAQGSIPDAVAATQKGVFGFLTKPIEREQLKSLIERALSVSAASRPPAAQGGWRDHVQSRSQVMERLLQTAQQVASSNISVLISGGSGSGKELLALAIHRASPRCNGPFIPLNCGALPEALLESELFGHVKGAFTGAVSDHVGLFRAASLIRQLMAFSRKQEVEPKTLSFNSVVGNVDGMLQRLIGEDIQLVIRPDPYDGHVNADLGQLEQVLINLVVNARDAMPNGGLLAIETSQTELTRTPVHHLHPLPLGQYVKLTVTDTGCGMDADVLSHLFEPFFTTKEEPNGTGLGLSTVFGIVSKNERQKNRNTEKPADNMHRII